MSDGFNYQVCFYRAPEGAPKDGDSPVGVLDFNGPRLAFRGDAEESAKMFVDWVAEIFASRLQAEYERGFREALESRQ